jgi:hypothetical protein
VDRVSLSVAETAPGHREVIFGDQVFSYHFEGDHRPAPFDGVMDFALVACILFAMRRGVGIQAEGAISSSLLRNIEQFQEIWTAWRPRFYRRVDISCSSEIAGLRPPGAAREGVFAYSGGIDGVYTLLSHLHQAHGRRNVAPRVALMVHGFDLPLEDREAFEVAAQATKQTVGRLGIPLTIVRTDWRKMSVDWGADYVAGLASCLHQFAPAANVGAFGAGDDCNRLRPPWGSNPITNPLLSSDRFELCTEGLALGRTARLEFINRFPEVAGSLRVCWEGPMTGRNCGQCEKCIRTKLNFMALGSDPLCFDRGPTVAEILGLRVYSLDQLEFLEEARDYAVRSKRHGPWLTALKLAIARNRALLRFKRRRRR